MFRGSPSTHRAFGVSWTNAGRTLRWLFWSFALVRFFRNETEKLFYKNILRERSYLWSISHVVASLGWCLRHAMTSHVAGRHQCGRGQRSYVSPVNPTKQPNPTVTGCCPFQYWAGSGHEFKYFFSDQSWIEDLSLSTTWQLIAINTITADHNRKLDSWPQLTAWQQTIIVSLKVDHNQQLGSWP